jgi:hypothetical protein
MPFLTDLTRPQWGGANSDVDIHIEEHLGIVDGVFETSSKLAPYTNIRTLRGTNTARIDRIGNVDVSGRKSGEDLVISQVRSDKAILTVDTLLYTRHQFDNFDEWTSSIDIRKEVGRADGIALAKQFDVACLTQAMKCADFEAPTHLAGAFYDGIEETVTISGLPANGEADADLLVRAHRASIEELINRDLGDAVMAEGVTFVSPWVFTILLDHKKLQNVEFQGGGVGVGNNFAAGRIAVLNGIRIVETPRIPQAAVTSSPLGSEFHLTAAQVLRQMITIIPSMSLYAAQVHPLDGKYWEWEEKFSWVLDTFQSYNIGQRRPDSVATVAITRTLT